MIRVIRVTRLIRVVRKTNERRFKFVTVVRGGFKKFLFEQTK